MEKSIYNQKTNQYTNPAYAASNAPGTLVVTPMAGTPPPIQNTFDGSSIGATTPLNVPSIIPTPTITPTVTAPSGTITDGKTGSATITPPTTTTSPEKTTYQKILEKVGGLSDALGMKSEETKKLQEQQKLTAKTENATKDYNAYNQAKLDLQQQIESANVRTGGGTTAGGAQEVSEITRRGNANLANLAVQSQASQGLLSAAEKTIKDKIDAQFQPITDQIDYLTKFASLNANDLTEKEKFQLTENMNQKKTDLANVTKTTEDLHSTLLKNGAPISVYSSLDKVNNDFVSGKLTASDAQARMLQIAAPYGVDNVDKAFKQQQLDNARLQGQKLSQEIESGKPATGEYAPIINAVSSLVGATKAPAVKRSISTALENGDFKTAYANVANAVEDSLTGTNKTKFADARTDIGVMSGMRNAIEQYTNAGGNIGFLKGSADDIAKKFGQLATDKKFAALGVQLQREFQTYRNSMTGAAFSPAESKEYAAVNPRSNASLDLNLATIDGALAQLSNRVTSTIDQRIPDAKKIYDLATGLPSNAPVTSGKLQSGVTFKVVK